MSNQVSAQIAPQVKALAEHYEGKLKLHKLAFGAGTSPSLNWYEVFTKFIASVTQIVSQVSASPGDKRQATIDAALAFWKQSVAPILADKVGMPWVYTTLVEPAIEKEIPVIAAGVYDAISAVIGRITGGQPAPAPSPSPSTAPFTPY